MRGEAATTNASREVLVVRTGTANTASVLAGLRRADSVPQLVIDVDAIRTADYVVLPGVGALAAAMAQLTADGLVDVLVERVREGRPTLAVCLGLQLLARTSEESPGVSALGVFEGHATRFPDTVRVPQLGWNHVAPGPGCRFLQPGHAYFANSYRLETAPDGWSAAFTDHGGHFVAALERGDVLACQFHPELSGQWGLALMERWLGCGPGGASC